MTPTVQDMRQSRARARCIGGEAAFASLQALLTDERPLVMALHGLGGVGKTCLAREFAERAGAAGARVLCLASGGGQQAPVLAAAGAIVTSLDASAEQLAKDRLVADRDGLALQCVEGDMRDLSGVDDAAFDLVFHPCSNLFVADPMPVWRECARVLRPGGALLAGFMNPAYFLFDHEQARASGELRVVHRQPYRDLVHAREPRVRARLARGDALVFGHSLEQQIGGQLRAGFALLDLYEDRWDPEATLLDRFAPTSIATRGLRCTPDW